MNNSTVNFSTASTNSTTLMDSLNIYIHGINVLFGLPTHSYVIWLIVTGSGVASGFFNLNLSVCETGNCLISLFYVFYFCTGFSHLTTLTEFLQGIGITGRPLFQCLMCFERYLAVVHPVTFLKLKPLRYRVICCTVAWIITLGSSVYCVFTEFYMYIWFYVIQSLLFLPIQLFCLVAVLRALKQSGPGERGREREEENHMKRRAFLLIVITTVSVIIFYMPFTFSGFFFILTRKYIKELFSVSFIFNVLISFVQPALYLHRVGKLFCLCSP